MSLLGEITKNNQALRYHAKSAEIAGKNLAHVNDEDYARQRVLSRDGAMYREVGSLGTSALEMGGLDHARSDLLDRRVVSEVAETASLDARKEILDLLQSVLGERVTRQGINAGPDDAYESDLAPGSLARALNDFFNSFQELTASPDEVAIRQELYHKVHTLGKRFNEAGDKFEDIEADLTTTVQQAVVEVNAILTKLHEVNKQIRRFELQDKGKAATYRDRRQALLEQLSKLMSVKVEQDRDRTTGQESGLINLFVTGAKGEKINLLDPNGAKAISTDWGQEFDLNAPAATDGKAARVRAKIGADGKLGRVEVIDGGAKYSDADGPILVAFPPPPRKEQQTTDAQAQAANAQAGVVGGNAAAPAADLQAGQPVNRDPQVGAQTGTAPVAAGAAAAGAAPAAGAAAAPAAAAGAAAAATVPALYAYEKGEVFHYEGSYYQALDSTAKGDNLADEAKFVKITSIPKGDQVREFLRRYSDVESYAKGEQFYYEGKLYQVTGEISPSIDEAGTADAAGIPSASQAYAAGDVMLYNGLYYQAAEAIQLGQTLPPAGSVAGDKVNGFHVLGTALPAADMAAAQLLYLNPTASENVTKGQYLNYNGKYYLATSDFTTGGTPTNAFNPVGAAELVEVKTIVDKSVKTFDRTQPTFQAKEGQIIYDATTNSHYTVKASFTINSQTGVAAFDPTQEQWEPFLRKVSPKLVAGSNNEIIRRMAPVAFNPSSGQAVELNFGLAEAVLSKGELVGFSILGEGKGYPSTDAVFVDGVELALDSGAVHGFQRVRVEEMELFRNHLNNLAKDFVTKVNQVYNPEDEPGGYVFGFDANLGRARQGANEIMEKEYGIVGSEGDGQFTLFREEVDMTVPYPETETFMLTFSSPIFPEELAGKQPFIRGSNDTNLMLQNPDFVKIYGSARRMKHVTLEADAAYAGADGATGTDDDGRTIMKGYEDIPFRMQQGDRAFVMGDNFQFDAIPANSWNVAKSMRVDADFTVENIKTSVETAEGANDVALAIAELANGEFTDRVSAMNTTIGNSLSDVADNLDHQQAVERLLLDERQAVSSVSIDEEVSSLMRYQRSFQASARVLSTLDRMLELVVMGLTR